MKKYSSNRAQKGKTAYRTPSRYKIQKSMFQKQSLVFSKKIKKENFYETK